MKSTPTNTPKYHLADVDPDLRTRVLDLCFRRLFDDALDVLLKHGFIHYTRDDLINFYHWAPATLPSQTHIDPEPTPKTPRDYSPPPANQIADIRSRLAELPPDLLERVNHALKHDPIQHAATLLWKAGVGLCSAELYEYRKTLFPPNSLIDAYTQDPPILRPASPYRGCGEAQPQQSPTAAAVAAPESIFPIIPTPASGADVAPAGSEVPAPSTHVLADPLPPVPSIDLSSHP
ncbi:MAG TPA: hypothetical protein VJ063_03640, partial [Verrucomicrobiae bacterium]|nr:hypothetical protein [Verrucomicrobiae bacterium]